MVRSASSDDVPAILELIRELAAFERAADSVRASADDLRTALFGDRPSAFAHVAEDGATITGVAIWYVTFSTWTGRHGIHLEDLIVSSAFRGKGIGRELVGSLAQLCAERGYRRLEWRVLDWNIDAQGFYRSLAAAPMPEWIMWRLAGDGLAELGGRQPR